MNKSNRHGERGIYLMIGVVTVILMVWLASIVIRVGYRAGNREIVQNHANLLALGALENFVTAPSALSSYSNRVTRGLNRAKYLFSQNSLKGIDSSVDLGTTLREEGTVLADPAGELEFGIWYDTDPLLDVPPDNSNPCRTGPIPKPQLYPCFKANAPSSTLPPTAAANAVRLTLRNKSSSPILAPILGDLGSVEATNYLADWVLFPD